MKKKLMIVALLFLPIITYGATCEIINDNQTGNERNLVCDATKDTTTLYKTGSEVEVLNNSVCRITCTEEILFSIDPIKKVLSGTSFNYPLYASGERKCTAVYNYNEYETKIRRLVNEYALLTGTEKQTKANELVNYYAEKKSCDEFVLQDGVYQNKYEYSGNVSLKVETSTREVTIPYEYVEIDEYDSNVYNDIAPYYNACNYNETTRTCQNGEETVAGWTETVRTFGKYTMKDTYLEKYTGEVKDVPNDDTCNAKDRFFVELDELTRPTESDTTDKGYRLTLTAKNLGNNLTTTGSNWDLNVECWYQVKNLMFPQKNVTGNTDVNYEEYGRTAFEYRIIDLNNPFPERSPGANWVGKEHIISSTKDRLSTLQRFIISLDRSSINKVREYNDVHSYDAFNFEYKEKDGVKKEYSSFVEAFDEIIDRK